MHFCVLSPPKFSPLPEINSDVQALDVLLLIIVLRKGLLVHFNFCFLVVSAKLALIFLNTKKKFKKCKQSEKQVLDLRTSYDNKVYLKKGITHASSVIFFLQRSTVLFKYNARIA